MKNQEYLTKEMPIAKEVKDDRLVASVAISPAGHQFVNLDIDQLLHLNGFKSMKEAKQAGWKFK